MNWHIEHHMYAGVPCYNLKKLHTLVANDMPQPRTLFGAWKEMRQIWKTQLKDKDYQFETEVPDSQMINNLSEDYLTTSIGDIAPNDLR